MRKSVSWLKVQFSDGIYSDEEIPSTHLMSAAIAPCTSINFALQIACSAQFMRP
jgi:hypothetical protein